MANRLGLNMGRITESMELWNQTQLRSEGPANTIPKDEKEK